MFSTLLGAQGFWLNKLSSAQADHVEDIVIDDNGFIYAIGDLSLVLEVKQNTNSLGTLSGNGDHDILVAKFDQFGQLVWMRNAGGTDNDVGLKLALGTSGLAVTGIFTGTADLFGTTLNSQSGSTDMFVALLDTANGATAWVRSAGGPNRTVTPSGISVDTNGDIVVAGKFSEEAYFGTDTLYTGYDSWVMDFGLDVFIAKWNSLGAYQWVQQGQGKHSDFAVDVVTDANNNIYTTGQFSDTITFDQLHPNISVNSIFLVKFDPNGNEQWFRRCGGSTLNQVKDLLLSSAGDLLILGDASGSMLWADGGFTTISNPFNYAYFLLRVDLNGTLIEDVTNGSDNPVRSRSICENDTMIGVYGRFECSFTGLQQHYGADGLFMATGPHDLFIATHRANGLALEAAQQFGGSSSKSPGAITSWNDEYVFCGSFESELFFPRRGVFFGDPFFPCGWVAPVNGGYCGDPFYSQIRWLRSDGLEDAFLARIYYQFASPYDWWERQALSPVCDRSRKDSLVMIKPDLDSIITCSPIVLELEAPFAFYASTAACAYRPSTGPKMNRIWNTGATSATITASTTGWYWAHVSAENGCYSWTDSIYVEVRIAPTILLSDSTGQLLLDPPPGQLLSCDTMYLWADTLSSNAQFYWVESGGDTTIGNHVVFDSSGIYNLFASGMNGCPAFAQIDFIYEPVVPFPNITSVQGTLVDSSGNPLNDTLGFCETGCVGGALLLDYEVNGQSAPLDSLLMVNFSSTLGCNADSAIDPNLPIAWTVNATQSGWHQIEVSVSISNSPCGLASSGFLFQDSIFILLGDPPQLTISDVTQCPGDTVSIPFSCNGCDSIFWNGPGIVWTSVAGDSILVDEPGFYEVDAYYTASSVICSASTGLLVGVTQPPIFSDPYDGIICPNDSVLLYTTMPGLSYQWSGPGSASLSNNDSIWVNIPGDYYITVEPYAGCLITNGPGEVSNFSSPFIEAVPSGTICLNSSVDLLVVAGPSATIQWQAPLIGSSAMQTVTQPGTYSAIVNSCGVDWTISYDVINTTVDAQIASNYYLCDSLGVDLTAPPGGAFYQWLPSGSSGQTLHVDTAGVFQLVVTDPFGCMDTSQSILVQPNVFTGTVSGLGDTICAGQTAVLNGSGNAVLHWLDQAGALLDTGATLAYSPLTTDTVYLAQVQNNCTSASVPVIAVVNPSPLQAFVLGDSLLCEGDSMYLWVLPQAGAIHSWQTPFGNVIGDSILVYPASTAESGSYSVQAILGNCSVWSDSINVSVNETPLPGLIIGDTLLCLGDTISLFAQTSANAAVVWSTPQGTYTGNPYVLNTGGQTGIYTSVASFPFCSSDSTSTAVKFIDCFADGPFVPNVITPNNDGSNDALLIENRFVDEMEIEIFNRWGQRIWFKKSPVISWDGTHIKSGLLVSEGVYFYFLRGSSIYGEPFEKSGYVHVYVD